MEQALVLDPLSLPLMSNLGDAYSFAGRFEEGLEQYNKIIELEPNSDEDLKAKECSIWQ